MAILCYFIAHCLNVYIVGLHKSTAFYIYCSLYSILELHKDASANTAQSTILELTLYSNPFAFPL